MSPFAPWSVYRNRVSEGTTVILTLGDIGKVSIDPWVFMAGISYRF